jgi:hypothetical protein
VRAAIEGRCGLIAVVAPNAEQIHDQIDDRLLEADEDTAVVTTWHADLMDAVWTVWASEGPVFVYTQSPVDLEKRLRTEGLNRRPRRRAASRGAGVGWKGLILGLSFCKSVPDRYI